MNLAANTLKRFNFYDLPLRRRQRQAHRKSNKMSSLLAKFMQLEIDIIQFDILCAARTRVRHAIKSANCNFYVIIRI